MTKIRRGDIFYIEKAGCEIGCEQRSGRPGIVVSNDMNNMNGPTVEIVYCTTKHKPELHTHVTVLSTPKESTVLCEQVTTVAVERLGDYIGRCNSREMAEIDQGILVSLGLGGAALGAQCGRVAETDPAENDPEKEVLSLQAELRAYKNMFNVVVGKLTDAASGIATMGK